MQEETLIAVEASNQQETLSQKHAELSQAAIRKANIIKEYGSFVSFWS